MAADDQEQGRSSPIEKAVFFPSAAIIFAAVAFALLAPGAAEGVFGAIQDWISETAGWFYLLCVGGFVIVSLVLAFGSWGRIKLGPQHEDPEYGFAGWFAMLFSAGMGIGLMFFAVAEPLTNFTTLGAGSDPETARRAMVVTFFHWGVHAWAIYAVVGLILAYFTFRHNLPLTIRSALYPLIGKRIYGPIGHIVDVTAVIGTLFGVATSLGFGVAQVNAGLAYLFGAPEAVWMQMLLIAGITMLATLSVVAGLDAGIKRLSKLNLWLALALLAFVFVTGPTLFLLGAFTENLGAYLTDFIGQTFRLEAYGGGDGMVGTTLFYWGWWISWSPFVGMFIARISRGRTIREFVLGVLILPSLFTFLWLTIFGNSALAAVLDGSGAAIADAAVNNVPVALFVFLETLPLGFVASILGVVLVITFFVTSSDSGSLVIDTITSGGHLDPPVWQRVFWAVLEGAVAAALLLAGGLAALQTAAIAAALPFSFVIILAIFGLMRALHLETARHMGAASAAVISIDGAGMAWRDRLKTLTAHPKPEEMDAFLEDTVKPALEQVAEEIRKNGGDARVRVVEGRVRLNVDHDVAEDFLYAVRAKSYAEPHFAFPHMEEAKDRGDRFMRAEVHLVEGGQHYSVYGYTKEQLIQDVLRQYNRHLQWMHLAR